AVGEATGAGGVVGGTEGTAGGAGGTAAGGVWARAGRPASARAREVPHRRGETRMRILLVPGEGSSARGRGVGSPCKRADCTGGPAARTGESGGDPSVLPAPRTPP